MPESKTEFQKLLAKHSDLGIGIGVILVLTIMFVPLPGVFLDLLLTINLLIAFVILLAPIYILRPSDFSVFPGMLLVVTLFRLSLNVATTRMILSDPYSVGKVIQAFGTFMIGGNYVVGLIIFLILFIINFKVITAGSNRIAEVAARFTLDAMPGKQMAVDADLNNGIITEEEAKEQREQIRRDADFYGAMDGASKFVKGDALAGLIITFINIVAGIVIGYVQKDMEIVEALETYTILTVGDGLAAQIPSLLISSSAGIIVTRAGTKSALGEELITQVFNEPKALIVAGSVVALFGFIPGLPWYFFIPLGLGLIWAGINLRKGKLKLKSRAEAEKQEAEEMAVTQEPEDMRQYLQVDPLELEIGYSLLALIDENQTGDLLDRITSLRKQIALEIGILVPPIRIRDNTILGSNQYVVKIRGEEIARGECLMNHILALDSGGVEKPIKGIPTREPAFGLPALWIPEDRRDIAEMHGYTVIEPAAMIATHLSEIVKQHADQIITRQDVQTLLDNIKEENEAVVKELVPNQLTLGQVEQVLKNLLHEGIPIRDMVTILETLADYAPYTRETETLTEYVRYTLSRTIARKYIAGDGSVYGITLAPKLEQLLTDVVTQNKQKNLDVTVPPQVMNIMYRDLQQATEQMNKSGLTPLIMCSPVIRSYVKRLIEPALPHLPVISFNEIPTHIPIKSQISIDVA